MSPSWGQHGLFYAPFVRMQGQQSGYRLLLRGGYTVGIHIISRPLLPFQGFAPFERSGPAGRVGSVRIEICDKPFTAPFWSRTT